MSSTTVTDVSPSPAIMLRSADGQIALGPLHAALLPFIERWFNVLETDRTQGDQPGPRIRERVQRWMARVTSSDDMAMFAIYVSTLTDVGEQVQPIGMTWLSNIDERQRTASFAISIGDDTVRGRGYGTTTTRLMLDYAFHALGLHHVSLEVFSNNPAGVTAYTRAGFRECGRFHEQYRHGQEVHDVILMECLQPWFASTNVAMPTDVQSLFSPDVPR